MPTAVSFRKVSFGCRIPTHWRVPSCADLISRRTLGGPPHPAEWRHTGKVALHSTRGCGGTIPPRPPRSLPSAPTARPVRPHRRKRAHVLPELDVSSLRVGPAGAGHGPAVCGHSCILASPSWRQQSTQNDYDRTTLSRGAVRPRCSARSARPGSAAGVMISRRVWVR